MNTERGQPHTHQSGGEFLGGPRCDDDLGDVAALQELLLCVADTDYAVPTGDNQADRASSGDVHELGEVHAGVHRGADQTQVA